MRWLRFACSSSFYLQSRLQMPERTFRASQEVSVFVRPSSFSGALSRTHASRLSSLPFWFSPSQTENSGHSIGAPSALS
jgi:hypothetical protein